MLFVSGCEIATNQQPPSNINQANNVIINEVFLQPPPNQNPYYWIEFFNPLGHSVDVSGWKLRFKTMRTVQKGDTSFSPQSIHLISRDTVAKYYDVPLTLHVIAKFLSGDSVAFYFPTFMDPNSFVIYVSDENRMKSYTDYGPGNGQKIIGPLIISEAFRVQNPDSVRQDSIVTRDSLLLTFYDLGFLSSGQLVLKDSLGGTVDVFRYGNYTFDDFGEASSDPYPGNHSMGPNVPYQSYARFAGAYTSGPGGNAGLGNSAADFYVTGQIPHQDTRPIPNWLSQARK